MSDFAAAFRTCNDERLANFELRITNYDERLTANSQKRDKVAHGSKLKVNFFVVMFVISFVLCIFAENKELCYDTVDIKH